MCLHNMIMTVRQKAILTSLSGQSFGPELLETYLESVVSFCSVPDGNKACILRYSAHKS